MDTALTAARIRNPDRALAMRTAKATGRFWSACFRCGEWFGGHEWTEPSNVPHTDIKCVIDQRSRHATCGCPFVSKELDAEACRRFHEMHGEERCTKHEDCAANWQMGYLCAAVASSSNR